MAAAGHEQSDEQDSHGGREPRRGVGRRAFLRGVSVAGVASATAAAAGPARADEAEAALDFPFDVAKVLRVRRRRLDVKVRRTGATVRVTPELFKRGWKFKRGDLVAVELWGNRQVAVPYVQTHTGSTLRGNADRVRIGGVTAVIDTEVARRSVRRARRRMRRGADRAVGVFVRNTRTGQLRCLGVRADG